MFIYFVVYLKTLLIKLTGSDDGIINELQKILKILNQHLPVAAEENKKNVVKTADLRAEISTKDLKNTKQEC